ncbi:class IV lanthionine synthetase LanL [Actinomadura chibensis]|uniref:non-specific serine/threonine protein kinase n=1 Tax=Actinomadura chibensis TaxID=392828 RepID=A0A5D0NNR2_9ACTN|nr:class IV lanthionine synthetase LanL [Actinomadura chibensis]TYB45681.1 protein kinase/lanthionine synthetase C family protein [Actinomadura chibensis]
MAEFNFSVFSGAAAPESGDARLTGVLDRALAALPGPSGWTARRSPMWRHLTRDGGGCPAQGWKLHVSATPASAEEVLDRALAVLLAGNSPFKFAASHDQVAVLNARNTSRGHSGKFLTVYPESDAEAVRLAAELHEATAGLAGPRILSDRQYAPGSLVHYRYGAFVEDRRITNDGFYAWVILDPDGNPVEDRRSGTYQPPSWVTCPFPDHRTNADAAGPAADGGDGRGEILIGTRFAVREAIRHTNKGGVYRAVDTRTGEPVVLKEARPHVAADETGRDIRDSLRAEHRALTAIAHLGVAPRPVELFTQGGHLFLAEEMVPGTALRQWSSDLIVLRGWGAHLPAALEMADRLTGLMIAAHGAGLIVRDFNPNNIMVRPDGTPVLIDLELAVPADDIEGAALRSGTPGYSAPEQMDGAPPHVTADYFSLGATLCHVITAGPPYLLGERPAARPLAERLAELLRARTRGLNLPAPVVPMLLGLTADDPDRRWTPARAREALAALPTKIEAAPAPAAGTGAGSAGRGAGRPDGRRERLREQARQAVAGISGHLLASMTPGNGGALWPASCVHGAPDPCSVQHGAAGVLGALVRCHELAAVPGLPPAIGEAARWILARLDDGAARPAGLYFGAAGAAWAVLDAGLALDDRDLVDGALAAADRLPFAVPGPDVTHGTAGLGLTALHLFARTGRERYADRAVAAADALVGGVEAAPGGPTWSTPAQHESKLAGKRFHGFAHGVAGVGYFLIACAEATGRDDYRALAVDVGESLLDAATITDRAAMWGAGHGDAPTAPFWCHGAAGIGAFLARLGAATGDERFARYAERAARAVLDNRWRAALGQCHGLSGNGDFLLDMAALTGDDRYRDGAWRLAELVLANRARRDGHLVFPDEFGQVSVTWGDGMSGILAFLLRLRHGAARMWTADAAADLPADDADDADDAGVPAAALGSGRVS